MSQKKSQNDTAEPARDDAGNSAGATLDADDIDIERFTHHTTLPHTWFSRAVDRVLDRIGSAASWVWVALIAVIVMNVVLRKVFGQGRVEFEELQWHLYALGFLVGMSYTLAADEHIRVDVLHERLSLRTQCWIELYGIVLLLVPFTFVVLYYAVPFVVDAFVTSERSQAPGGLPHRFLIKSFLGIGFALLLVAGLSRLSRVSSLLFGAPAAVSPPPGSPAKESV